MVSWHHIEVRDVEWLQKQGKNSQGAGLGVLSHRALRAILAVVQPALATRPRWPWRSYSTARLRS